MTQGRKQLLEFGPLLVFMVANWKGGIFWATGLFMAATLVALAIMYASTGKVAKMPLIGAIFVAVFGGLTLYLQDETFIKIKVTLIDLLFGGLLLGGLAFGRSFLKDVMGEALEMPAAAWRTLTLRWGLFFFTLAGLNELIWRNVSTDTWVTFKVFGAMGLTLVFAVANAPFMMRHMSEKTEKPSANG
jgi:intracellular septation protein